MPHSALRGITFVSHDTRVVHFRSICAGAQTRYVSEMMKKVKLSPY
jgi:hypothetical protein